MAKKKFKNVKLEQTELEPVTIGVFENRRKSSLGIFIIMSIFILAVIFMPEISEFVNKLLEPEPTIKGPAYVPPQVTPPEDEEEPEQILYDYTTDLKIETEDLNFDTFNLDSENNTLTFNVFNISQKNVNITNLNYYVELYNEEQTLLQRTKLLGNNLEIDGNLSISQELAPDVASTLKKISIVKKSLVDYPPIYLTPNDEGIESIVCKNTYEEVTYIFQDNKLKSVNSVLNYPVTAENYLINYSNYSASASAYNNLTGVSALFSGNETTGLNVVINVDLTKAQRFYVYSADTFSLDTEPKVVSFEMKAQGFTCE